MRIPPTSVMPTVRMIRLFLLSMDRKHLERLASDITTGSSFLSLVFSLLLAFQPSQAPPLRASMIFLEIYVDQLGIYMILLVNLVAFLASLYIDQYLEYQKRLKGQASVGTFHLFFNLFHLTMVLLPVVDNVYVLWAMVALTTVASIVLVGFRQDPEAMDATQNYIFVTSIAVVFALVGTFFLQNSLKDPNTPMNWSNLIASDFGNSSLVKLAFLFVLIGYGTKAGLAPGHTWLPDGHGEAPYPVSALLSGVLLKSALYAILRFATVVNHALPSDNGSFTSISLILSGLFSLSLSAPFVLGSIRTKRLLAYHSFHHVAVSFVGFGIGMLGLNPILSIALWGALLHMLNHAMIKSVMFLAFGNLQSEYLQVGVEKEEDYRGAIILIPRTARLLALGGLGLVGAPIFSIFLSELIILLGALQKVLHTGEPLILLSMIVLLGTGYLIYTGLVHHLIPVLVSQLPHDKMEIRDQRWQPLMVTLVICVFMGLGVLQAGPLNLGALLSSSVNIVLCGKAICPLVLSP